MPQKIIFTAETPQGLHLRVTRENPKIYRINWKNQDSLRWVNVGAFSTQYKAMRYAFRMIRASRRLEFSTLLITSDIKICSEVKD